MSFVLWCSQDRNSSTYELFFKSSGYSWVWVKTKTSPHRSSQKGRLILNVYVILHISFRDSSTNYRKAKDTVYLRTVQGFQDICWMSEWNTKEDTTSLHSNWNISMEIWEFGPTILLLCHINTHTLHKLFILHKCKGSVRKWNLVLLNLSQWLKEACDHLGRCSTMFKVTEYKRYHLPWNGSMNP